MYSTNLSTPSQTIANRLFGDVITYTCPLPLEECLDRLRNRSDYPAGYIPFWDLNSWGQIFKRLFNRNRTIVTLIVYLDRDNYQFRVWSSPNSSFYYPLTGILHRVDQSTTEVTADSRAIGFKYVFFVIPFGVCMVGLLSSRDPGFLIPIIFFMLFILGLLITEARSKKKAAAIVLETLSSIV